MSFQTPQPRVPPELLVSFPSPKVLLLTLNRPGQLNAMTPKLQSALDAVLTWFESEPSLWVVIVTGTGRAFCAGQDLKLWLESPDTSLLPSQGTQNGFGAISRRRSVKPIIAAVNGICMGGGTEIILNCDLVVVSEDAKIGLPEVSRGVHASQGGIPRLAATAGHQLASELLLLARPISAQTARTHYRIVNRVVPASEVLSTALDLAHQIVQNSPDAVWSTKVALNESRGDVEGMVMRWESDVVGVGVFKGENIREGLTAFKEKRQPVWQDPQPIPNLFGPQVKAKL